MVSLNKYSKSLWLVDTFSPYGINYDTGVQDESGKKNEAYCDDLQKLKDHFKEFNNVHFLQGLIPDCLDRLNVEKISCDKFNVQLELKTTDSVSINHLHFDNKTGNHYRDSIKDSPTFELYGHLIKKEMGDG